MNDSETYVYHMDNTDVTLSPRHYFALMSAREQIKRIFPDCRIILYGSCARGLAEHDSDVELLIVVSGKLTKDVTLKFRSLRSYINTYEPDSAKVDLHIASERQYRYNPTTYYSTIRREGIYL